MITTTTWIELSVLLTNDLYNELKDTATTKIKASRIRVPVQWRTTDKAVNEVMINATIARCKFVEFKKMIRMEEI